MLVLVGLNLFSIYQVRDLQKKQISISNQLSTEQSALALLAYPSTETLAVNPDVQELVGSLLVDRDKKNRCPVLMESTQTGQREDLSGLVDRPRRQSL